MSIESNIPTTVHDAINTLFTYHAPSPEQVEKYAAIRNSAKDLAMVVMVNCPSGPDRSASLRLIREAVMTANAAIATNNAAASPALR